MLSHPERIFLTVLRKGHKNQLAIRWNHFINAGLTRSQIQYIGKQFEEKGYIQRKNEEYKLIDKKLIEIKEIITFNAQEDQKFHDEWKTLFVVCSIFFILLGIPLLFSDFHMVGFAILEGGKSGIDILFLIGFMIILGTAWITLKKSKI